MELKDRFKEKNVLVNALLAQKLVEHDVQMAKDIAEQGELVQFANGDTIIEQGDYDQDVFFIIAGEVSLLVHGNQFPYTRTAGISIGEMSALDPTQPRSATVKAITDTVTLKLTATAFNELANKYPKIHRLLAVDLSQRLNQRNELIEKQSERPKLFIISTVESLSIARDVKAQLDHDDIDVTIWSDTSVFDGGDYTLEALERAVQESDFGLAILQDDDVTISRNIEQRAPRDNVIFELGLFMGLLTRKRTFIALPRGVDQKLASDLKGLTPFEYKITSKNDYDVSNLAHSLRKTINKLGKRDKLDMC
ncbi:TIR domain-containing protein [Acinetobacter baumannii]|uniref:TIR domain-containing protein n=1 Tax=Acinetobacter baumannii TaxID=470 RepID=UPI00387DCAAD